MYVLDTNVLSETMRETPHPAVASGSLPAQSDVLTTAVSQAEILYGVRRLQTRPAAARLATAAGVTSSPDLRRPHPALPIDAAAASILPTSARRANAPVASPSRTA
ncbi:MAG: PIN domain-containing protein [Geminicoccaceae bacterium]